MSATPREAAAGAVFRDMASQLATLVTVLRGLSDQDEETREATADAAAAMAACIGMVADRAACALEGGPLRATPDEWLIVGRMSDALQVLETQRARQQL